MHLPTILKRIALAITIVFTIIATSVWWLYPADTDDPIRREDAIKQFFEMAYTPEAERADSFYERAAREAREFHNIRGRINAFVRQYELHDKQVLDVGSGTGYLQDAVEHYTGIDISRSAARHYHKRFVAGTATAMPFRDGEFDAAWSIWVLEHIPNPEAALVEIRRVVKPDGLLYLSPAWDVKGWEGSGIEVRDFAALTFPEQLERFTLRARRTFWFWSLRTVPNRIERTLTAGRGATRLRYRRVTPNFEHYWQPESDAVNSLDSVELAQWFESRGDRCLTCAAGWGRIWQPDHALVIRRGPH